MHLMEAIILACFLQQPADGMSSKMRISEDVVSARKVTQEVSGRKRMLKMHSDAFSLTPFSTKLSVTVL